MEDKRISLPETILATIFTLSIDAIDVFLWLVGIPFVSFLIDIPVMMILYFWLWLKGADYKRISVGNLIEFLPTPLEMLPFRTVSLWFTIYKSNHPKGRKGAASSKESGGEVGAGNNDDQDDSDS